MTTLIILSVVLAVIIIAVVAAALIKVRQDLEATSADLATLAGALQMVESEHLQPLEPAVKAINAQFDMISERGAAVRRRRQFIPGDRAEGQDRGGEEASMTLEWIGDAILLLVVLPVVVYLLRGVLNAANSIVPSVQQIAAAATAGSKDLDATALLLTTQDQVQKTIEVAADYGGSLDVILDDA